jgi:hypothetical protein
MNTFFGSCLKATGIDEGKETAIDQIKETERDKINEINCSSL